jgi:hypothetical protein
MATFKEKRDRVESLVLGVVKRLDNKKMENYRRYETMFKGMTDSEFKEWSKDMGKDLDGTIQIFQLPFEEMSMTQIKAASEFLKMPLEEYIWYRHNDPEGIRTKMKVPVGYLHIKRVQQFLAKKNRYGLDIEHTELKTGQVKGESKIASISDVETFALSAINANKALEEFLGPRADNQLNKNEMYRQITKDGYATIQDLSRDITQSTTLNTLNTYLIGSGISSDLIIEGLETIHTVEQKLKKK